MCKKMLSALKYLIFLGGGIALVWWQLSSMQPNEKAAFGTALKSANYWIVLPVIIMNLLSHLSRAMRWKLLIEPLGHSPQLKNVFATTMIGYLANTAIPRLGEILKCTLLGKYEKIKVDKLVGTILIERTFDFLCYLLFIAITVVIQINVVGKFVQEQWYKIQHNNNIPIWVKLLLALVVVFSFIFLIKYLRKRFPENKIFVKTNAFLKGMGEGFIAIKNLQHRKQFIAHTLFIWLMYLLQIYIGFAAMEGTAGLDLKAACSVLSLATLAMIATPGGIGSFPLFVAQTLSIYAISETMGIAFGWLMWGISTLLILIVGLIAAIVLPYINKTSRS